MREPGSAVPLRRRPLARRSFLRGVGAAVALPWLDAMQPAFARSRREPLRTAFVFVPNGIDMHHWRPGGPDLAGLPPTLAPLQDQRDALNVLSGLTLNGGRALGDGAGDHARAAGSYLTTAHPRKTGGEDIRCGVSIDQVIAGHAGADTRFASLPLGCERGRAAGSCDSGYACAYSNNVSWRDEKTPVIKETDPRAAFDRLFGNEEDGALHGRRLRQRRSVLDLVAGEAQALHRRLGPSDRDKLQQYLDSVRETERRLEEGPAAPPIHASRPRQSSDYRQHLRAMYELIALAFETDSTRVATFMTGNAGSNRSYRWLEVPDGHHELSHHRNDPAKIDKIRRINRFHVEEFARFVARLRETRVGDGSLLDHSLVMYGSALSDGNRHRHEDLPILLAGRAGGAVRGDRHLRYRRETPLGNLFVSMQQLAGVDSDSFGDSTGRLEDLGTTT